MIEFNAHTAPEVKIPSNNHDIRSDTPNTSFIGDQTIILKKIPDHVEKHIWQLINSLKKPKIPLNIDLDSDIFKNQFLTGSKITPVTTMFVNP